VRVVSEGPGPEGRLLIACRFQGPGRPLLLPYHLRWSGESVVDVGGEQFQELFGGADGVFGFYVADDGDAVEGVVALAAHAIKESE